MTTVEPSARIVGGEGEPANTIALSSADLAMGRYAEGDERAFQEVFLALAQRLSAFLRRLCGSADLAQDLTQETFIRMHRARGTFAQGQRLVPWAYAIARNCYRSHLRGVNARPALLKLDPTVHDVRSGHEGTAEAAMVATESAAIVASTLAAMTIATREAFILIRFEGQSVASAAAILGASPGAVKLRAFRAYELLRAALEMGSC